MLLKKLIYFLLIFSCFLLAQDPADKLKSQRAVMEHISDAHDFHIIGEGHHSISLPLPVILWTKKGLHFFLSSAFHHDNKGKEIVESKEEKFVQYQGKIYQLSPNQSQLQISEGKVINAVLTLDFSFSKHVFAIVLTALFLLFLFIKAAKNYQKTLIPKGVNGFLEPLIIFVRDEIAIPNLGSQTYRFLPFLLTAFFFILISNLFGIIPFFPFSSNITGDVAVTFTLAFFTLVIVNINGNKHYWKHIFAMPGLPVWLLPLMIPIEIIGILSKPFALMVRLAVNISAGHIIILSLISLIFTFKSVIWAGFSVPFALIMNCLELLVAFLQAYIFTLLSSLFIGMAVEEHHEEHH